jgi:cyclophilin family peptidyl-prolyl cis-trans isomerase
MLACSRRVALWLPLLAASAAYAASDRDNTVIMTTKRGILGMARTDDPNSANSQFFIMFGDGGFLDGKYTAFGEVTSGMDAVDKIKAGTEANNGAVEDPDKIITMRMASGAKK